jgi:hypothetical protein
MDGTLKQHICDLIAGKKDKSGQNIMEIALKID